MAARLYVHRARPLRRNPAAWLSLTVLALLAGLVVAAPLLSGYDPLATAPAGQLLPPSLAHPLGTDLLGRDVWSRLLWGGRLSLAAGILAVGLVALPGTLLGMLAGYAGGWPERLLMRMVDVLLAFPSLLLTLTIMAVLGTGLLSAALAVGLAGVARFARLMRAATLGVRSQPYIQAARVVGCRPGRILGRHVLPNVSGTLVVLSSLELGYALLNISALGFLGLGAQPPAPEWGTMLAEGRGLLRYAPWVAGAPGLAITLSVLAVNLLGDAWREALDAGGR
jgi:peptide/nickel transport system permease protein